MKKFLILFLYIFSSAAFAQISITEAKINGRMQIGFTHTEYIDSTNSSIDLGTTGESSWDFNNWSYDYVIEAENVDPAATPRSDEFPSATVAEYSKTEMEGASTELWNYVLLNSSEYSNIGHYSVTETSGITAETLMKISAPEIITNLPLNYGDSWNQATTRNFEVSSSGFTTTYTVESDITRTVDAYGTLTFPDGSNHEVLRVKVESEITSSVSGSSVTTHDLHYTFFSNSGAFLTVTATDHTAPDNGTINIKQVVWAYGSAATDVEKKDGLPAEFGLAQNYPNPFNPNTVISFQLAESGNVDLRVYDNLGREIKTLISKQMQPGSYEVNFDGSNLSSGVYFYTLTSGDFVQTRKMMLLK